MVDKAVIDLKNVVGTGVYDILNPLWKEAIRHTYDRDEYVEYFNRGIAEAERKYGWGRNYTDDLINRYNSDGLIVEESYGDRIGQSFQPEKFTPLPSCAAPLSPHNSKFATWDATG